MSLIRRALERRAVTSWGPTRIPSNGELGVGAHSGEAVNEQTSLQVVAFYACVRKLADIVASLPWDAGRKQGRIFKPMENPPRLLSEPDPELTEFDWKHQVMVSLAMRGNAYGLITERDRLEHPQTIRMLHPDYVRVERDRDSVRIRSWVGNDEVPYYDLFHVRGFTLPGHVVGLSPLQAAAHSIGLGLAAQRFGANWFRDGAAPSGQLVTDQDLDPDKVKQVQRQWVMTHGGRRLPAVLTGGFKWEPISITPEESQFLETRKFTVSEMAMLVGLPPHMIGHVEKSTSWGTGIEQQSIGFVTYDLRSWLSRIEAAMTKLLPRGQRVRFNVDGLLRGDIKSRYEAHRIAIEAGFKNPDEVRELEDLEPIPDGAGRQFRQPLNYGPLGFDPAEGDQRAMADALEALAAGLRRRSDEGA